MDRYSITDDQLIKDNLNLSNIDLSIKISKSVSSVRDRKAYLRKKGILPKYESPSIANIVSNSKVCRICKEIKQLQEFYKSSVCKDGRKTECKSCRKQIGTSYEKLRWKMEKEKIGDDPILKSDLAIKGRLWRVKNKESLSLSKTKYYFDNKDKLLNYSKNYQRIRSGNDNDFRLRKNWQKRVWDAVKGNCYSLQTETILGCSRCEFLNHIESKFKFGMTWDNYGKNGIWEIDHIIPASSYDLTDLSQLRLCYHFTNMQPLLIKDNKSKSYKVNDENAFNLI